MKLSEFLEQEKLTQEDFGQRVGSGVSQGLIWQWLEWLEDPTRGTRITAERAIEIEAATQGKVNRHELRPDLYPAPAALAIEREIDLSTQRQKRVNA